MARKIGNEKGRGCVGLQLTYCDRRISMSALLFAEKNAGFSAGSGGHRKRRC